MWKAGKTKVDHRAIEYPALEGIYEGHQVQPSPTQQHPSPNPTAESGVPVLPELRQLGAVPAALGAVLCPLPSAAQPVPAVQHA